AEVASYIPGPIGGIAAAVSAVSYAATGNWAKAAEMTITAAASLVGANTAVKAAVTAVKATRVATRVGKAASAAKGVFRVAGRACPIGNSFSPDTPVLMADGSYRPIGDIQVGDYVAATDPETGVTSAEPVLDVIVGYGTRHIVEISTDTDTSAAPLQATDGHPIWVEDRGWVKALEVQPGDRLRSPNGTTSVVTSVDDLGELADQLVINLNVGNRHTYTVRGASSDIVVHNCSKAPLHGIDWATHIFPRHVDRTQYLWKSKFASQSERSIRRMIKTAIKKSPAQPNTLGRPGHIHIYDFVNKTVGYARNGARKTRIKVVVINGKVHTAYPH
ncbi:Hint domain-containing protein, partial [Kitasatospora indigofera]|uniref:Hint domain-containing protein n=1 Tax=Kitasatospora indigofera TaxID=67307 RepID=UPI0033A14F90